MGVEELRPGVLGVAVRDVEELAAVRDAVDCELLTARVRALLLRSGAQSSSVRAGLVTRMFW